MLNLLKDYRLNSYALKASVFFLKNWTLLWITNFVIFLAKGYFFFYIRDSLFKEADLWKSFYAAKLEPTKLSKVRLIKIVIAIFESIC